jgi:hypothetical protein
MPRSGRASVPDVYSGEGTFSSSARPAIILAMNTNSKLAALQNEVEPIFVQKGEVYKINHFSSSGWLDYQQP